MRVLVAGGRDYDRWKVVHGILNWLHNRYGITAIIQGEARGADFCAKTWALNNGVYLDGRHDDGMSGYPADWDRWGKSAGALRNEEMLSDGQPDLVVIFEGGKGTRNMRTQAVDSEVPTLVVPDREWVMSRDPDQGEVIIAFEGKDDEPYPSKPWWAFRPRRDQKFEVIDPAVRQRQVQAAQQSAKRYEGEALF